MRFTYLIVFLFVSSITFGQELFKPEHFIEVSGVAEMEVDPNQITVVIKLKEFEENKSKVGLEKLDQDFQNALKGAGIDKKRLTLADAGSNLGKLGRREKDAFREKSYEIILTGAPELERMLEKLEPVKVHELKITRVHHTDMEKFKTDVKVKALQVAKLKAETLTRAIGSDIGKPIMIREWDSEPVYPLSNVMYKSAAGQQEAGMMDQQDDSGVSFKKIRLRAQITAQFEIK